MAWRFQLGLTLCILAWLVLTGSSPASQPVQNVALEEPRIDLGNHLLYFHDPLESSGPESVLQKDFSPLPGDVRLHKADSGYIWFLSPILINTSEEHEYRFLKIHSDLAHNFEVYLLENDQQVQRMPHELPTRHPSFEINFYPHIPYQILIKAEAKSFFWIQPSLLSQHKLLTEERFESGMLIYCIGTILTALFFNFAMYLTVGDRDHGWFVLFTLMMLFYLLLKYNFPSGIQTLAGLPFLEWDLLLRSLLSALSIIFLRVFLQGNEHAPKLDLLAKAYTVFLLFLATQQFSHPVIRGFLEEHILIPSSFLTMAINLSMLIRALKAKCKTASLLLISWLLLIVGGMPSMLHEVKVLPVNFFTISAPIIGLTLETILTSIALSYKLRELKEARQLVLRKKEETQKLKFFLRIICHDLANPLSVLTVANSLLSKKYPEDGLVTKIGKATKVMDEIIEYVRYSELKDGQSKSQEEVSLNEIIDELLIIFDDRIRSKKLKLSISVEPELFVLASETNLKMQVLANLLQNAIKFTPKYGHILINAEQVENQVLVELADSGSGIPQEIITQLTEHKGRLDSNTGTQGETGTGFGLSLAWKGMEECGGSMKIESFTTPPSNYNFECRTKITLALIPSKLSKNIRQRYTKKIWESFPGV